MMTTAKIIEWLEYWTSANLVAVDQIQAFDQVAQARRWCACMRQDVFSDVSDLAIWRAIVAMRAAANPDREWRVRP